MLSTLNGCSRKTYGFSVIFADGSGLYRDFREKLCVDVFDFAALFSCFIFTLQTTVKNSVPFNHYFAQLPKCTGESGDDMFVCVGRWNTKQK